MKDTPAALAMSVGPHHRHAHHEHAHHEHAHHEHHRHGG
jgi:hypothetical protein